MAKRQKMWIHKPPRQAKPKVPNTIKLDVDAKARELVDTVLKPEHVKPPSGDEHFNYIIDIYSKWHGNYFYFCTKYACPAQMGSGQANQLISNKKVSKIGHFLALNCLF